MTPESTVALAILVLTYVGVAVGRIPGLRLDRAGIAFLGGAAMIAVGPLSLEEAFRAIDFDTIALLLGMMIVVAHLKVSGAFRALGALAIEYAHAPFLLLVIVTVLAGVLSAFLVNDAICLVMAPIVLQVVRSLPRDRTQREFPKALSPGRRLDRPGSSTSAGSNPPAGRDSTR